MDSKLFWQILRHFLESFLFKIRFGGLSLLLLSNTIPRADESKCNSDAPHMFTSKINLAPQECGQIVYVSDG